jgi:hypothetical protein
MTEDNLQTLNMMMVTMMVSRDRAAGIATGYGLDHRGIGIRVLCRSKNFIFSTSSRSAPGSTQPPIQWVPGALSPGVKR